MLTLTLLLLEFAILGVLAVYIAFIIRIHTDLTVNKFEILSGILCIILCILYIFSWESPPKIVDLCIGTLAAITTNLYIAFRLVLKYIQVETNSNQSNIVNNQSVQRKSTITKVQGFTPNKINE